MKPNATLAYRDLKCASHRTAGATASLYENAQPWIFIAGGGDDCGVCISVHVPADATEPSGPLVDLRVPRGGKKGHDARAMVRALRAIPGWREVAAT
jgi:hypothetical protein